MVTTTPMSQAVSSEQLQAQLPATSLFGPTDEAQSVSWRLSDQPFELSQTQYRFLKDLGPQLHHFFQAANVLYRTAASDGQLTWARRLLDAGKPEDLVRFSQMNRFKNALPSVIRPDLLLTETGFKLSELDSVPGGIGFTAALAKAYQALGFSLAADTQDLPHAFLSMLLAQAPHLAQPVIAIVVSDEAADYRAEMEWLADTIRSQYPNIYVIHPKTITLNGNRLGFLAENGDVIPIDIVYRFFELFDLPNIPQMELVQYAVKKGLVVCTPPFKPYLEEKVLLGLLHAPALAVFWKDKLGDETFKNLKALVPETWILDPSPVPLHAQIMPPMVFDGRFCRDYSTLGQLTQKQRELVVKPSGFSPLAWGSRGVKIGHDMSQTAWQTALDEAFSVYEHTPYVLQRFENTAVHPYTYFDSKSGDVIESQGRSRLCPYYFMQSDGLQLAGILVTTCPKDKKIIHGMRDGVMRPAMMKNNSL